MGGRLNVMRGRAHGTNENLWAFTSLNVTQKNTATLQFTPQPTPMRPSRLFFLGPLPKTQSRILGVDSMGHFHVFRGFCLWVSPKNLCMWISSKCVPPGANTAEHQEEHQNERCARQHWSLCIAALLHIGGVCQEGHGRRMLCSLLETLENTRGHPPPRSSKITKSSCVTPPCRTGPLARSRSQGPKLQHSESRSCENCIQEHTRMSQASSDAVRGRSRMPV